MGRSAVRPNVARRARCPSKNRNFQVVAAAQIRKCKSGIEYPNALTAPARVGRVETAAGPSARHRASLERHHRRPVVRLLLSLKPNGRASSHLPGRLDLPANETDEFVRRSRPCLLTLAQHLSFNLGNLKDT